MGDAGSAPASGGAAPGFWTRLRGDAGDLRTWVSARWRGWRQGRAMDTAQDGLEEVRRTLGAATVALDDPPALPGLEDARACQAALADARAAHATAQQAHDRAREALEAHDRATKDEVRTAKARIAEAQASWEEARDRRTAAEAEVRRLEEAEKAKGPTPIGRYPKPNVELEAARGRVKELAPPLEEARQALARRKSAREELEAARAKARLPLKQARSEAEEQAEQTEDAVQKKAAQAAEALRVLGAAAEGDPPATPALAKPLAAVQRAAGLVGNRAAARETERARARDAGPGALRFGWKLGAVLVVGIVLLAVTGGTEDAVREEPPVQTAGDTPGRPAPPAAPPKATDAPPPSKSDTPEAEPRLTAEAAATVLALPDIATERDGDVVRQEVQGAPRILRVQPAPDGARRLRVRVDVLRREKAGEPGVPYGVLVDVLVDAAGRPLQVRSVGEVDPDLEALFEDE